MSFLGSLSLTGTAWRDQLQPASWRGVRFGVLGSRGRFGRRNAIHEYPNRDTVFVEDLGKKGRRIQLLGFLIGDDCIQQREKMIAAIEAPGNGELVHPTLGRMTLNNLDFEFEERWEKGRYIELSFSFIESGQRVFPSATVSTTNAVAAAANAADSASAGDFISQAEKSLKQGAAAVKAAVNTASDWAFKAQKLANDATNLYHSVQSLPGTFGRYFGGKRRKSFGNFTTAVQQTGSSINQLIALGSVARKNVSNASDILISNAADLGL